MPFKFVQNKIAIVEKENEKDYVAIQYLIENDWNLEVTKCLDPEVAQKTWQLKRKMDDGQVRDLPGKRITYHEKYSKIPKISNQDWKVFHIAFENHRKYRISFLFAYIRLINT